MDSTSVPTITAMSTVKELMYFLSFTCQEPHDLDEVETILIKRENNLKSELEKLHKSVDSLQEEYELREKSYGLIELTKMKYETELMESRKECYELKQKILELNENHEEKIKVLEAEKLEIKEKMEVYTRELEDIKEKIVKTKENVEKVLKIDVGGILGENIAGLEVGKQINGSFDSGMKGSQLNPKAEGSNKYHHQSRKLTGQLGSHPIVIDLSDSDDDLPTRVSNDEECEIVKEVEIEYSSLQNKKIERDPGNSYLINTCPKRKRSESEGEGEEDDQVSVVSVQTIRQKTSDERDNDGNIAHRKRTLPNLAPNVAESVSCSLFNSTFINPCDEKARTKESTRRSSTQINPNRVNDYVWIYAADMISAFKKEPELCMNAVCALYRQQFSAHKSITRGFSCIDLSRGTSLAKYLINNDPKNRLSRSVSEVREKRLEMVESCERLAVDYYKELFEIYQKKLDPFFPSS